MKFSALLAGLLLLSGCQSYFDEQQAMIDRQNAERDHAWCQSVGIDSADQRYAVCRAYAADLRMQDVANRDAKALGLMGLGAGVYSQTNQPAGITTCQPFGAGINCQSY